MFMLQNICKIKKFVIPPVYIEHENTFLHVRKRNYQWLKLRNDKGGEAGRRGARWQESLSLWIFLYCDFLALKGLKEVVSDILNKKSLMMEQFAIP